MTKTVKQIQLEIAKLKRELSRVREIEKTNIVQVNTLVMRYKKWLLKNSDRITDEWTSAVWMVVEK